MGIDLDKDFDVIEGMFNKRDALRYQSAVDQAREEAINASRQERITKTKKADLKNVRRKIVAIVLSAVVVVGVVSYGTGVVRGNGDTSSLESGMTTYGAFDELNMTNMSKVIGSLVYVKDENFNEKFDSTQMPILSQCTKRNEEGPYYLHDKIANKLEALYDKTQSEDVFLYAICALANDMANDIDNEVTQGGRTNIDGVIAFLSDSDNEYISGLLSGVKTYDELLAKLEYKDERGEPSRIEFRKANDRNAQEVLDIIEALNNTKGVSKQ